MSSGHAGRGRNNNSNGNKSARARHISARQRNPQGQPVGQHRAQITPTPAPIRITEISAIVEEDGFSYDRPDERQAPFTQSRIEDQVAGSERATSEPPAPPPQAPGTTTSSIRAPFAPGQSPLRGGTPPPHSSARQPGVSAGWRDEAASLVPGDEGSDQWRQQDSHATGRTPDTSYRSDGSGAWNHEQNQQAKLESAIVPESNRDVRGDVGPLIDSLRDLFERDREVASRGNAARCGICYLHFTLSELLYRDEEGFYVCPSCAKVLLHTRVMMVRRQQHL